MSVIVREMYQSILSMMKLGEFTRNIYYSHWGVAIGLYTVLYLIYYFIEINLLKIIFFYVYTYKHVRHKGVRDCDPLILESGVVTRDYFELIMSKMI